MLAVEMKNGRSFLAWLAPAVVAVVTVIVAAAATAQDDRPHGGHHGGHYGDGLWPVERGAPAPWTRERGGAPVIVGRPPPPDARDSRRFNGYWAGGRWYYGVPEGPAYQQPGFQPGFIPWRRGAYLPPAFESNVVANYWQFHLRRPPYGYQWVRVGAEFLLVSAATGLIFDVIGGD
jgi:Ni/Co efflux regulator RcnB